MFLIYLQLNKSSKSWLVCFKLIKDTLAVRSTFEIRYISTSLEFCKLMKKWVYRDVGQDACRQRTDSPLKKERERDRGTSHRSKIIPPPHGRIRMSMIIFRASAREEEGGWVRRWGRKILFRFTFLSRH